MADAPCPIWGNTVRRDSIAGTFDQYIYYSQRAGGSYVMSDDIREDIEDEIRRNSEIGDRIKVNISLWVCEQKSIGVRFPVVTQEVIEESKSKRLPSFLEIKERFMKYFINSRPGVIQGAPVGSSEEKLLMANIGVLRDDELFGIIDLLHRMDILERKGGNTFVFLHHGFYELSQINSISESKEAFVAMWFDQSVNGLFDSAIKPAIESCGYKAIRIDKTEMNDRIDDQIIASIKRAKFLVADFTAENFRSKGRKIHAARGGVYYEAGFAHGLGKSVIFMVEESQINDIHFDTRQYNHIVYSNFVDAKERLIARINATIDN